MCLAKIKMIKMLIVIILVLIWEKGLSFILSITDKIFQTKFSERDKLIVIYYINIIYIQYIYCYMNTYY